MTLLMATVTEDRLLQLPREAQLQLKPGQQIQIQIEATVPVPPNEKALAALQEIATRQAGRGHTDGAQTEQMLREGRAGAMYGYSSVE